MGLFGFGKKPVEQAPPKPQTSAPHEALRQLNTTMENLEKKRAHLETRIGKLHAQAKAKLQAKDRRGASSLMKQKKLLSNQITVLDNSINNLMVQQSYLESASTTSTVIDAMSSATDAIRHHIADPDDLQDKLDDVMDVNDQMREISDILGEASLAPELDMEIEDDLAELENELADEFATSAMDNIGMKPIAGNTDVVVEHNPVAQETKEEDDLAALRADFL
ncbi:hypothetical protein PCE1_000622 [Barthelona sp. PCE]